MTQEQTNKTARQAMLEQAGEGALVPMYLIREPLGWPGDKRKVKGEIIVRV